MRRMLEVAGVAIAVVAPIGAQTTTDPHRWGGGLSVDLGGIPDAFGFRCGDTVSPVVGGGLPVVHSPRRGVVAVFDARALEMGTAGVERSTTWVRVNEEYRRFRRDETTQTPLPSRFHARTMREQWTTVRIGIESPLAESR